MPKPATTPAATATAPKPAAPKATSPPKQPAAKPAPKREEKPRPVLYPAITVNGVTIPEDKMVISVGRAKALLDWVSEEEWAERLKKDHPSLTADKLLFPPEVATFADQNGAKVACLNNSRNRPFADAWARQLAQDILNRNWAGPITIPGTKKYVYGGTPFLRADGTTCNPGDIIELPEGTINGEVEIWNPSSGERCVITATEEPIIREGKVNP